MRAPPLLPPSTPPPFPLPPPGAPGSEGSVGSILRTDPGFAPIFDLARPHGAPSIISEGRS